MENSSKLLDTCDLQNNPNSEKPIKIEPEFNETVNEYWPQKSRDLGEKDPKYEALDNNPSYFCLIKQELSEHTINSNLIKTETPEVLIESPNSIKSEISETFNYESDPLETNKKYNCEACGKAFGRARDLKRHIRSIHEGVKNNKCETCGKAFNRLDILNTHILVVHEGLKNHKCEICGKAFGRATDLKKHIVSVHERIKNYKCETCGKSFCQNAHLKYHIKHVHEGVKRRS